MNPIYPNGNYYASEINFNPPMVNSYTMNYPFHKLYQDPIQQPTYQPTLLPIMNDPLVIPQRRMPNYSFSCPTIKKPHAGWKNREKFTKYEDKLLKQLVNKYGENDWNLISENMPHRNCRQCKERWCNYLSPQLNKSKWKASEDELLMKKVDEIGRKWVAISKFFHNRTDQMIKNRYNVLMRIQRTFHTSDSDESQITHSRRESSIDEDEIEDILSDDPTFSEGKNCSIATSDSVSSSEPDFIASTQNSETNVKLKLSPPIMTPEQSDMEASDKKIEDFIDYDNLFDDCDLNFFMVDTLPNI